MKQYVLILILLNIANNIYSLDQSWLTSFKKGEFGQCYRTLKKDLPQEDIEQIISLVDENSQKIKHEYQTIFFDNTEKDLFLFKVLNYSMISGISIAILFDLLLISLAFLDYNNIRNGYSFHGLYGSYLGDANSPSRTQFISNFHNRIAHNEHAVKVKIGLICLSLLYVWGNNKIYNRYKSSFDTLWKLHWLKQIQIYTSMQNSKKLNKNALNLNSSNSHFDHLAQI